jgi:hypothetical protein
MASDEGGEGGLITAGHKPFQELYFRHAGDGLAVEELLEMPRHHPVMA